jgi:hypothetical protein
VIAVAESDNLERIEPGSFKTIFSGSSFDTDMIKDPVLYEGRLYAHIRKDGVKSTYLLDGERIRKAIKEPVDWDGYCQRITSIIRGHAGYFAFYDGAENIEYNQEERTGVLYGSSLDSFTQINHDSPALSSRYGSGSIRYLEAKEHREEIWIWYEHCTEDWSHELRFLRVPKNELLAALNEMKARNGRRPSPARREDH